MSPVEVPYTVARGMPVRVEAEALLLHKTGSETVREVEPGIEPLGPLPPETF